MPVKTERAPMLAGERGAKNTQHNDFTANFEQVLPVAQSKPEIDLQSWASLGQSVKPSRTDRRQKRGWKRGAK